MKKALHVLSLLLGILCSPESIRPHEESTGHLDSLRNIR